MELKEINCKDVEHHMRVVIVWKKTPGRKSEEGAYKVIENQGYYYAIPEGYFRGDIIRMDCLYNNLFGNRNLITESKIERIYHKTIQNVNRGRRNIPFGLKGKELKDIAFKGQDNTEDDISFLLIMGYKSIPNISYPSPIELAIKQHNQNNIY